MIILVLHQINNSTTRLWKISEIDVIIKFGGLYDDKDVVLYPFRKTDKATEIRIPEPEHPTA